MKAKTIYDAVRKFIEHPYHHDWNIDNGKTLWQNYLRDIWPMCIDKTAMGIEMSVFRQCSKNAALLYGTLCWSMFSMSEEELSADYRYEDDNIIDEEMERQAKDQKFMFDDMTPEEYEHWQQKQNKKSIPYQCCVHKPKTLANFLQITLEELEEAAQELLDQDKKDGHPEEELFLHREEIDGVWVWWQKMEECDV